MGLGIFMREHEDDGNYRFDWYDPVHQIMIPGLDARDKMNAFELSCNILVDHFTNTNTTPDADL